MNDHEFYDELDTEPPTDPKALKEEFHRLKRIEHVAGLHKSANKILWQLVDLYEDEVNKANAQVEKLKSEATELRKLSMRVLPND